MRPIPIRRSVAGIMLIECLVYIGLLAVLLGLAFLAFYTVSDYSRHLSQNAADIARALDAGERWRKDVRAATATPQLVDSAEGAILHLPQARGEIQYTFLDGTVYRRSTEKTNESWHLLLEGVKSSKMQMKKYSLVSAWRWEVELQARQKVARVKPLFTFQAVAAFHPAL